MNRRVLLSGENEPDQRRNLFRTRCKCEDKCCDVIVDEGSTNNLVSEKMVINLKLRRFHTRVHTVLPGCRMTMNMVSMSSSY